MKYFKVILLIIFVTFYHNHVFGQETDSTQQFLDIFEKTDWNGLQIYSPRYDAEDNEFEGEPIPEEFFNYFKSEEYVYQSINSIYQIFSVYKIELDANTIGLIARHQSQYSETAVSLFLFDTKENSIVSKIELADSFGDGMWYFYEDGWLEDLNSDRIPDLVKKKNEWWEDDDGNEETRSSFSVFLYSNGNFEPAEIPIDSTKYKVFGWGH